VDIGHGVGREFWRLVGLVADKILIAVESCVRTDLEGIGDRIVEAGLDAMARDGRDLVARQDLYIAVFVGERAV